jgi:hypothetical protein
MDPKTHIGVEAVLEQLEERVHTIDDKVHTLEERVGNAQRDVAVLYERTATKAPALARVEGFITKNQNLLIAVLILFSLMGGVPGVAQVLKLLVP